MFKKQYGRMWMDCSDALNFLTNNGNEHVAKKINKKMLGAEKWIDEKLVIEQKLNNLPIEKNKILQELKKPWWKLFL